MLADIYSLALTAPVNALQQLGLNAELRETNEIEVDGKRIAGTGGGRIDEACVVVGNLLFDFDFEVSEDRTRMGPKCSGLRGTACCSYSFAITAISA